MLMRLLDRCGRPRSRSGFAKLGLVLGLLAVAAIAGLPAFAQERPKFGLDDVIAKAKALADAPYVAPVSNLPDVFSKMQFADYQKMQPKRDRFAWMEYKTPFKLAATATPARRRPWWAAPPAWWPKNRSRCMAGSP